MLRLAFWLAIAALMVFTLSAADPAPVPLGVALQTTAGPSFEVIFDPSTGVYSVEPVR